MRELWARSSVATTLGNLGHCRRRLRATTRPRGRRCEESLAIMREFGDQKRHRQRSLNNLGDLAHDKATIRPRAAARRRAWRSARRWATSAALPMRWRDWRTRRPLRQPASRRRASGARPSDCARTSDRRCRTMNGPATIGALPPRARALGQRRRLRPQMAGRPRADARAGDGARARSRQNTSEPD